MVLRANHHHSSRHFLPVLKSTVSYQIALPHPGEYKINVSGWLSTDSWYKEYDRIYIYNDEGKAAQRGQFSSDEDPFAFHMFDYRTDLFFRVGTAGTYTLTFFAGDP